MINLETRLRGTDLILLCTTHPPSTTHPPKMDFFKNKKNWLMDLDYRCLVFRPRQNVFKRVVANANCGRWHNRRQSACYPFAFCVFWLRPQFSYQVCPLICSYFLLLLLLYDFCDADVMFGILGIVAATEVWLSGVYNLLTHLVQS